MLQVEMIESSVHQHVLWAYIQFFQVTFH